MKTRIITGLVLVPILALVLLANYDIMTAAIAIISVIGLNEFYKATQLSDKKLLCAAGYIAGVVIPALTLTLTAIYYTAAIWQIIIYVFMFYVFVVMIAKHKTVSVIDAGMVLFSVIYIPLFLTHLLLIRMLDNGALLIWLPFIGAFATDTFAYFSGVFFGKHKLCPEISPKKTIEGSIGGTVGCIVLLLLYGLLLEKVFDLDISFVKLAALGVIVSPVSQIGDLTASIIKRKFGVKDYGSLFPGHGGILDRLDSVIAVAPLVYIYLTTVGI